MFLKSSSWQNEKNRNENENKQTLYYEKREKTRCAFGGIEITKYKLQST